MAKSIIEVQVKEEKLVISIGIGTLAIAASLSEIFQEYDHLRVTDRTELANSIVRALKTQDFNGTTPVTRILDEAIEFVAEHGLRGISSPAIPHNEIRYN